MIDIHAHVLPGLDDGPANIGEAVELLRAAAADNISTIVACPHMLDGVYNAPRAAIIAAVTELNRVLPEHGLEGLVILPGADVHVDTEIPNLLRRGELVTVADRGKHIMLELPADIIPNHLDQLVFEIQLLGIRPLVSHPERNQAVQDNPAELIPLVEAGCLVQVTAGSILGTFGQRALTCVQTLFGSCLVHFVATDMHGADRRAPHLTEAARVLGDWLEPDDLRAILEDNPTALIRGAHIDAPDPIVPKPRKKRWFFW